MTDEKPSVVADWVAKRKPGHPVAILKDRSFEDALGVKGFPSVGVIDPDGNLTYAGFRTAEEEVKVEEGAARSQTGDLWPEKLLKKPIELARSGKEPKAYAEALKAADKAKEEAEQAWAQRYVAYLEGRSEQALDEARSYVEDGRVLRAVESIEPYAEAKPPYPNAEALQGYLDELAAMPTYKDELKGGKKLEAAIALQEEGEYTDAVKAYVSVYKKYEGTEVATAARNRANELVEAGRPGYRGSCSSCRTERRACEKHAETVKL